MSDPGGLLLKADDGSLYFIRDEVLSACKVEGEYLEDTQRFADGTGDDVEGFAFSARSTRFNHTAYLSSPNLDLKAAQLGGGVNVEGIRSMSTVMCPW